MNREQWLTEVVNRLRPAFVDLAKPVPDAIRISCGWPSKGATSPSKRVIGQCWGHAASKDKTTELFISPTLHNPLQVAEVVVHELVHAAVGVEHKHKAPFVKVARAIGLVGKPTATVAGEELQLQLRGLLSGMPDYPHRAIEPLEFKPVRKSPLIKGECLKCGYLCRLTAKWVLEHGAPLCPNPECKAEPFFVHLNNGEGE